MVDIDATLALSRSLTSVGEASHEVRVVRVGGTTDSVTVGDAVVQRQHTVGRRPMLSLLRESVDLEHSRQALYRLASLVGGRSRRRAVVPTAGD